MIENIYNTFKVTANYLGFFHVWRFPPEGATSSHDIIKFGYEENNDPVREAIKGKIVQQD